MTAAAAAPDSSAITFSRVLPESSGTEGRVAVGRSRPDRTGRGPDTRDLDPKGHWSTRRAG